VKVATFNANSIRARLPVVIDWLNANAPDVLCIQETKVRDDEFPLAAFSQAGWHAAFRGQKAYNGVAIISKKPLTQVWYGLDDGGPPDDARLIRAVCGGVSIVNTYVPQGAALDSPQFAYKIQWFKRLRDFFDRRYSPKDPLIWTGDLNVAIEPIDVWNPEGVALHVCYHESVRKAMGEAIEWGFVDVFRKYCRETGQYTYYDYRDRNAVSRHIGWRLDYIFATKPLADKCKSAYIDVEPRLAEKPSDHTFMVAEFAARARDAFSRPVRASG
jgi:exodeoxyribonuclease-3